MENKLNTREASIYLHEKLTNRTADQWFFWLCNNRNPKRAVSHRVPYAVMGGKKYYSKEHLDKLSISEPVSIDEISDKGAAYIGMAIKASQLRKRVAELEAICAEAYQVVGILASDCGRFGDEDVDKTLDNLSQQKMVHSDALPFECKRSPG